MCADDYTPTPCITQILVYTLLIIVVISKIVILSICFLVENRQVECSKSLINQEAYDKQ